MDGRRRFLRAVAALAAVSSAAATPAAAQSAKATTVRSAALDWLALADRGDGGATWDTAGKLFRDAITRDRWSEALAAVRKPLGAMSQRSVLSTKFPKKVPGAPDGGVYAIVLFRTSFANRTDGRESVTLEQGSDGVWRVVGYLIQ